MNSRGPSAAVRATPLLTPTAWCGVCFTLVPLMLWSSVSITVLTHSMGVPWAIAWIPAAATDGAMLVTTAWAVNHDLDRRVRRCSAWVAVTGIAGSVIVAGIEHYVTAAGITPPPELAALIGGIPSLMGALVVHVIAMIHAQQRREQAELESELENLTSARGVRAAVENEIAATERAREQAHKKQLDRDSANRRERHDAQVAEVERLQHQLRQAEVEAATRSQQALRQECDKVAVLRSQLATEQAEFEAEQLAADQARSHAEADRDAAAQALDEARADVAEAEAARREAERVRSRLRRRSDATVSQTSSQPVSQPEATSSQTASRAERIGWAVEKLRAGVELRPRDIDNEFGDPRNGSAVLAAAKARFDGEVDGELRAITSGTGDR